MSDRADKKGELPAAWAKRLFDQIEPLGEEYHDAPWTVADDLQHFVGLNLKQARASEILLALHHALRKLPEFADSKGAAVVHDVAGALHDVTMGGKPRLFAKAVKGTSGSDGIARNYLKTFAVRAVRLLVEAHDWRETAAVNYVAESFAKAGATGRKNGPLSPTTVQDWCNKAHPDALNRNDANIGREVELFMEECRQHPNWPGIQDDTLEWIDRVSQHPLLGSKYG